MLQKFNLQVFSDMLTFSRLSCLMLVSVLMQQSVAASSNSYEPLTFIQVGGDELQRDYGFGHYNSANYQNAKHSKFQQISTHLGLFVSVI